MPVEEEYDIQLVHLLVCNTQRRDVFWKDAPKTSFTRLSYVRNSTYLYILTCKELNKDRRIPHCHMNFIRKENQQYHIVVGYTMRRYKNTFTKPQKHQYGVSGPKHTAHNNLLMFTITVNINAYADRKGYYYTGNIQHRGQPQIDNLNDLNGTDIAYT